MKQKKRVNIARWHVTSLYSIEETWSKYVMLNKSTKAKCVGQTHLIWLSFIFQVYRKT